MATSNHGGARANAGRKPMYVNPEKERYVAPAEKVDFDKARARNEQAKAELNELELSIKRGLFVERAAIRQETATALASLAQTLRSVPDNLERKMGVSPEVAGEVGMLIDNALDDLATSFEEMVGHAENFTEEDANDDLL